MQNGFRAWKALPSLKSTPSERRIYLTHVAIVCDDSSIQPLLPQVIFVGDKTLTREQWRTLSEQLPHNVYVKRLPKAWNNATQHRVIMRMLGMTLSPHLATMQPILVADAAPLHLTDGILKEIHDASIWFLIVPAGATGLLQPLDTHVFYRFKLFLKQRFNDAMTASPDNKTKAMVCLLIDAVKSVLQGHKWQKAFLQNGIWKDQAHVCSSLKRKLGYDIVPDIPDSPPAPEQIKLCWPRNRCFNADVVMPQIPKLSSASPLAGAAVSQPASQAAGVGEPAEACSSKAMIVSSSASPGMKVTSSASSAALPGPMVVPTRRLRSKTTVT